MQLCQSALLVPEEVMHNLAICRTALRLQQEASQLQHVAIQQCNILQVQQEHISTTPSLVFKHEDPQRKTASIDSEIVNANCLFVFRRLWCNTNSMNKR